MKETLLTTAATGTSATFWRWPALWLTVALVGAIDLIVVLGYSRFNVGLPPTYGWLLIVSLFAEATLLGLLVLRRQSPARSFMDALITVLTSGTRVVVLKFLPSSLFLAAAVVGSVAVAALSITEQGGVPVRNLGAVWVILVIALLVLLWLQMWSVVALTAIIWRDTSIGQALAEAGGLLRRHAGAFLRGMLPFLVIDFILIALLFATGATGYETILTFDVSEAAAEQNYRIGVGPGFPGTYPTTDRVFAMIGVVGAQLRGPELSSLLLPVIGNRFIGVVYLVSTLILLPLRLSTIVGLYTRFAEPIRSLASLRTPSSLRPEKRTSA